MMEMKEQTGSRKKYLVPVVVLMLCLVALTGAAYAYASELTVQNNEVGAQTLTLDLATPNISTDVATGGNFVIFTDNFTYAPAKTDAIKYELQDDVTVASYKIKVTGDAPFDRFTLSSTGLETIKPFNSLAEGTLKTKTLGDLYNFTYTIGTTEGGSDILTATDLGAQGTVSMTVGTAYYVTLTATLDGESGVSASGTVEPSATTNTASTYATAFTGSHFTLVLNITKA